MNLFPLCLSPPQLLQPAVNQPGVIINTEISLRLKLLRPFIILSSGRQVRHWISYHRLAAGPGLTERDSHWLSWRSYPRVPSIQDTPKHG